MTYTKTVINLVRTDSPAITVDQTVGEITQYDLLDERGFLHLTQDGRPIIVQLDHVTHFAGITDEEAALL